MTRNLDSKDLELLKLIQNDCRMTAREISNRTGLRITTVFARIKRLERLGIIKGYHALLNGSKLNAGTTAFVLISFTYSGKDKVLSQRKVANQIANLPEVQEVHITSGEWDILTKVKAQDVDSIGKFVIDKLRLIKGIEKTLTCFAFESEKETTAIPL